MLAGSLPPRTGAPLLPNFFLLTKPPPPHPPLLATPNCCSVPVTGISSHLIKSMKTILHQRLFSNIARGTTDPGYWVFSLNNVSDWNQFEISISWDNFFSEDNFYSWDYFFSRDNFFSLDNFFSRDNFFSLDNFFSWDNFFSLDNYKQIHFEVKQTNKYFAIFANTLSNR